MTALCGCLWSITHAISVLFKILMFFKVSGRFFDTCSVCVKAQLDNVCRRVTLLFLRMFVILETLLM